MNDQPKRKVARHLFGRLELMRRLETMMEEDFGIENYDPIVRAVQLTEKAFRAKKITEMEVTDIHIKVAPYIHGKVKHLEISGGEDENGPKPVKLELLTRLKEALD